MSATPFRLRVPADALLAGLLVGVCETEVIALAGRSFEAILATAALTVPVAWRRKAPLTATCCVMAAVVALAAMLADFNSLTAPMFALFIPPYSVALYEGRRRARVGLLVCLAGAVSVNVLHPDGLGAAVFSTGMVAGSWAVGRALRSRRRLTDELRQTAERLAAEEEGRERLAVADERTRITRELNAVVARSISQMVVQSDAARRLLEIDGARADSAMAEIEETGRDTLEEMRRILGVLRRIDGTPVLAPQPGIGEIPALIEHACDGGRRVTLRVDGEPRPIPASVDISIYRILDDALAIAADNGIEILLSFGEEEVVFELETDGAAPGWPTPAMHERVTLCDGTLDLLPCARGRTRLRVWMPRVFDGALA